MSALRDAVEELGLLEEYVRAVQPPKRDAAGLAVSFSNPLIVQSDQDDEPRQLALQGLRLCNHRKQAQSCALS